MKNYSGAIFFLAVAILTVTVIDNIILRDNVEELRVDVQTLMATAVIPEGDMLLKQIANFAASYYHANGEWPRENKIFDLGPGARSRNWYFESVVGIATGDICITVRRNLEYERLSAVVHPDSTITYLLTGQAPVPQRAG